MTDDETSSLVLICRRPAPGVGKRRLAVHLGEEHTADLAHRLLDAALEDAAGWPGPVIVSPADSADETWAATLLSREVAVIPQGSGNLGARLNTVDARARAGGHRHLIYIGSDSPALTEANFAAARSALRTHDVVLLPAEDGGVTLMGARAPWPALADLRWGSENLAADLERRCADQGLSVHRLEAGYDIDRSTDLARLLGDLADDTRPARERLHHWLEEHYG